ncbi:MAG: SagB/ThcOx family dehydrogenase [Bacillota bacterium]|nr:SagB/ThcOx family dehydrogenase [Bacillota bacterium]
MSGRELDWDNMPETYKQYPPDLKRVKLPEPDMEGGAPLFQLLKSRRSVRSFAPRALDAKILSQMLWAALGISLDAGQYQFRTAPSAGALYPVEMYILVNRVTGINPGIYYYDVQNHMLILLREGEFGRDMARAALGQGIIEKAPAVLIWSALVRRGMWKYEQRAYRYFYLDAGHIAQNAALAAVSLGMGSCQIGAFFDDEVNELLQLDGEKETALYMTAFGSLPQS